MKTVKMSLANIQGKLSRAEMKNIMAGSAFCVTCYDPSKGVMCGSGTACHQADEGSMCMYCNGHIYCC